MLPQRQKIQRNLVESLKTYGEKKKLRRKCHGIFKGLYGIMTISGTICFLPKKQTTEQIYKKQTGSPGKAAAMAVTVTSRPYGIDAGGRTITEYTLTRGGTSLVLLDRGCTYMKLFVPGRDGTPVNVLLAPAGVKSIDADTAYMGQTVGRVCNRTEDARFVLDGKEYHLSANDGTNHLHGTVSTHIFAAEPVENGLRLTTFSPADEEGYPGDLQFAATVTLPAEGQVEWHYEATATADTPVNFTNHAYFNLAGAGDIKAHTLWLASNTVCEHKAGGCTTGRMLPVAGTPMDFTAPRPLGEGLAAPNEQLRLARGYDHNFALDAKAADDLSAVLYSPETGIEMSVYTSQPAIQVYTGNWLFQNEVVDEAGRPMFENQAVALETQHYPCSLNQPAFPGIILKQGDTYAEYTRLAFACK